VQVRPPHSGQRELPIGGREHQKPRRRPRDHDRHHQPLAGERAQWSHHPVGQLQDVHTVPAHGQDPVGVLAPDLAGVLGVGDRDVLPGVRDRTQPSGAFPAAPVPVSSQERARHHGPAPTG
jgi:hypothetical protein